MKLNLSSIITTLKDIRRYVFPIKKIVNKFSGISSLEQLKLFIQERSAHVTQTTLYGYLKTRIGTRYAMMFEDETFSNSINIAKWNIYMVSLSDCVFYVFSYLIKERKLKQNDSKEIFLNIINEEEKNGLSKEIYEKAKENFLKRYEKVDFDKYYLNNPFQESCLALYHWSPVADELKILDKKIVLNSMKLKWNLVEDEFKNLTNKLKFD